MGFDRYLEFINVLKQLINEILDGIVDDYKAAELPLIHQHFQNVENMVDSMKIIWIFDRGYTAMELYAIIIEMNSFSWYD